MWLFPSYITKEPMVLFIHKDKKIYQQLPFLALKKLQMPQTRNDGFFWISVHHSAPAYGRVVHFGTARIMLLYNFLYTFFPDPKEKKKKSNPTGEIETEEKTALVGEPLNHSNHSQVESLSKKGAQESNQYANQVLARRLIIISRNSKG